MCCCDEGLTNPACQQRTHHRAVDNLYDRCRNVPDLRLHHFKAISTANVPGTDSADPTNNPDNADDEKDSSAGIGQGSSSSLDAGGDTEEQARASKAKFMARAFQATKEKLDVIGKYLVDFADIQQAASVPPTVAGGGLTWGNAATEPLAGAVAPTSVRADNGADKHAPQTQAGRSKRAAKKKQR